MAALNSCASRGFLGFLSTAAPPPILTPTCLPLPDHLRQQAIPAALAGKENAVAEDSRALVGGGLALESSSAQVGREWAGRLCGEAAWGRSAGGVGECSKLPAVL